MKILRTVLIIVGVGAAVVVFAFLLAGGSNHHSLTIDVFGSYFPAWMICILTGLALTFVAHWIVQVGNLKAYVGPAALIYSCLMIIFTFATWILFYQN